VKTFLTNLPFAHEHITYFFERIAEALADFFILLPILI